MAVNIPANAVAEFGKKLEGFSATLSDEERTLLNKMLERGSGLSGQDLSEATGGNINLGLVARHVSFAHFAPTLNASFFTRLMSW
jgi:hypothetical protein